MILNSIIQVRLVVFLNNVLLNRDDIDYAVKRLKKLGLPPHPRDYPKSWDLAQAIELIVRNAKSTDRILDCGSNGSPILGFLHQLGYKHLYGVDIGLTARLHFFRNRIFQSFEWSPTPKSLKDWIKNPRLSTLVTIPRLLLYKPVTFYHQLQTITLKKADIQNLPFEDNFFHVITCLSVIEHGVDVERFIREASRVLKTNGLLYISIDYWCEKIDTSSIYPFSTSFGEMKVFTPEDIKKEVIPALSSYGMELLKEPTFDCKNKTITWMGTNYTFFSLAAIKR